MRAIIPKSLARGTVSAPPSKSMAHRLLICAALSGGNVRVENAAANQDILATLDCLSALGAQCEWENDTVHIRGVDPLCAAPEKPLPCRESGSTLRFFIPIALLSGREARFTGSEKLLSRPLQVYETLCREKGLRFAKDEESVTVQGPLVPGEYVLPGDVSSQFVSGLLFALPLLAGDSVLRILPPVESRSYILLTVSALRDFGVNVCWQDENTLLIPGNQRYQARDARVEGDYSGAAFLEAFNCLGGSVSVTGLREDSLQGDRVYRSFFPRLVSGAPTLDLADCPDLAPVLFALAAALHGGIFTGTKRLRIKESDRAETMAEELRKFGAEALVEEDSVQIIPKSFHAPAAPLSGHNDHRVVMALALLLTRTGGEIAGAEAVNKSFPDFFQKLKSLGIEVALHDAE